MQKLYGGISLGIRQALAGDFDTVRQITRQTIQAVYPHYYPAGAVAYFLAHHSDESIRLDIDENRVFLCISDSGEAVGTVTVADNEIGRLFVLPATQGYGYGGSLLRFAEQLIAQRYAEAELSVSLPAKPIYLKYGYRAADYHMIETENGDFLCYDTMKKCVLSQYQRVKITTDRYHAEGISAGDTGYIIECWGDACEVECSHPDGTTYALRAIPCTDLEPLTGGDLNES